MGDQRQEKIKRFKEQKEIKEKLIELQKYVKQEHVEDEVKVFIKWLQDHESNVFD